MSLLLKGLQVTSDIAATCIGAVASALRGLGHPVPTMRVSQNRVAATEHGGDAPDEQKAEDSEDDEFEWEDVPPCTPWPESEYALPDAESASDPEQRDKAIKALRCGP